MIETRLVKNNAPQSSYAHRLSVGLKSGVSERTRRQQSFASLFPSGKQTKRKPTAVSFLEKARLLFAGPCEVFKYNNNTVRSVSP